MGVRVVLNSGGSAMTEHFISVEINDIPNADRALEMAIVEYKKRLEDTDTDTDNAEIWDHDVELVNIKFSSNYKYPLCLQYNFKFTSK